MAASSIFVQNLKKNPHISNSQVSVHPYFITLTLFTLLDEIKIKTW
jgi:hypothetical protein